MVELKVRCPKCGSEVSVEPSGRVYRGFCVKCGRELWACPLCDYVAFTYRGVAGHIKTHRRPASTSEIIKALIDDLEISELDDLSIIKVAEHAARSSKISNLGDQLIIYTIALQLATIAEVRRLTKAVEELAKAVRSRGVVVEAQPAPEAGLPSFVRGNPWLKLLSGEKR